MQINLVYDASTATAPAGFTAALAYAAGLIDALITNPITVNIAVGWNEINGTTLPSGTLAEGGDSPQIALSYTQLITNLTAHADNATDQQALASLPAPTASQLAANVIVTTAQEKAWGLLGANAPGSDGAVGFSSKYTYNFDPNNQNVGGEYGFIGIAEHELTHAMGRTVGNGAFNLTDYSAPGLLNTSGGGGYYSVDGGVTSLGTFASSFQDPADWALKVGDAFNYAPLQGSRGGLAEADQALLGTLGFSVANTQFAVGDVTTGTTQTENGLAYSGPVAGLTQELIYAGSDSLNITAGVPNSFIHTGSGTDAINVAAVGGANVLDGSTGSNFLTGGSGFDTFYLDDRGATSAIWSTIVGFHAGDNVTVWGVTQADFAVSWLDGLGAVGYTGVTGGFVASGKPNVDVTITGYSAADLTNGRLNVTFGTSPNEPGLPGSVYMNIFSRF